MITSLAVAANGAIDVTPIPFVQPGKLFPPEGGGGVIFRQRFLHHEAKLKSLNCGEYLLPAGTETIVTSLPDRESILFLTQGEVTVEIENQIFELSRLDTVYVPKGAAYRFRNQSRTAATIVQMSAPAGRVYPAFHSRFLEFSEREERIRQLNQKTTYLMFDVTEQADKLLAGFTFFEPFARTWPPTNHTDQEEVNVFIQGKGSMEVYESTEKLTFVREVKEGDLVAIPPHNYHPVFSQEEPLVYLWCIAGNRGGEASAQNRE